MMAATVPTTTGVARGEPASPPVAGRVTGSVGLEVGAGVGLAGVVGDDVGTGPHGPVQVSGGSCTSYAPMSHSPMPSPSPSNGLGSPRWSVSGQAELSPASIAGLGTMHASLGQPPWIRACVSVGPPLSARGPRSGSTFGRSPGALNGQVPSESRLWPRDVIFPLQPTGELWAMMLFARLACPNGGVETPPPPEADLFWVMVLSATETSLPANIPAYLVAEFPLIVEF
jgi:hypothetical protein